MRQFANPTLIIGLGGTGFHCISKVKSLIKKELADGEAFPDCIKFLCIDFDNDVNNKNHYKKIFEEDSPLDASGQESSEWIKISSGRTVSYENYIRNPQPNADMRFFENDQQQKNTLIGKIGGFDLSVGAGQKRVLGKIGISYPTNRNTVFNKIQPLIHTLAGVNLNGCKNFDTISVMIVNSFSGGAGAGIFLDIMFMIAQLRKEIDKYIDSFTFNFLPDAFIGISNVKKGLINPNTFAAITELEYIYQNTQTFIPTHCTKPIADSRDLPKAHFLINKDAYNGSKVSGLKPMIYSTAKVMHSLALADSGLSSQWSNFQANMGGNYRGKTGIFCSLGYSEIFFNYQKLEDYTVSKILARAWKDYTAVRNDTETRSIGKTLGNLTANFAENLLIKENTDFASRKGNLKYIKPNPSKKTFSTLKAGIERNLNSFKDAIENLVQECYDGQPILNLIENTKEKILISSIRQNIIDKGIEELKKTLESHEMPSRDYSDFNQRYELLTKNIDTVPKKYKRWYGGTKSAYYKTYIPRNIINPLTNLIERDYAGLVLYNEVARLVNNDIQKGIDALNNRTDDYRSEKIKWINEFNEKPVKLKENEDNIIFLESWFQKRIDRLIETDVNINRTVIEDFLGQTEANDELKYAHTGNESKVAEDREKEKEKKIRESFAGIIRDRNLNVIMELNELKGKNISGLKEELNESEINIIVTKANELINPLWDREEDYIINEGSIDNSELIGYTRLESPEGAQDYFGRGTFNVNDSDIIGSSNPHIQSCIKLELGLPAYLIRSMQKYSETFEDVVSKDKDKSVNFFAYNEIRKKCLNGSDGIFIFKDSNEVEKEHNALHAWAFGWAAKIFFKEQGRVKIKVSDSFVAPQSQSMLLSNGVYDVFRNFGNTADLVRIFNTFKEDVNLIEDVNNQLEAKKNASATDYLKKIAETFKATNNNNPQNKFRTEKKAYSQLNVEETELLNREQAILEHECEEIIHNRNLNFKFQPETVGNETFKRLVEINQNP
jgi:hypothetical protein